VWKLQYCLASVDGGACCQAVAVWLHQQLCQAQRRCCLESCKGMLLLNLLVMLMC
jgi:hypothetical protein